MRLNSRVAAGAILAALGIGMLAWGVWPPDRNTRTVSGVAIEALDAARAATPQEFASLAREPVSYSVVLEYPRYLRVGDADIVQLRLILRDSWQGEIGVKPMAVATAEPPVLRQPGHGGNVLLARLELEGAEVMPAGEVTAPWGPDQGATFVWAVQTRAVDALAGTAWLFLVLDAGMVFGAERAALSAIPLQLTARTFLGLSGPASRVIGSALILLATLLGLPAIDRAFRSRSR